MYFTVIQKKCTPDQSFPITHQGRVAALQSLSGTGSLRVGAGFIARFLKGRTVYISNPPTYGARIAAEVVNDPELFAEWKVGELIQWSGWAILNQLT